MAIDGVTGATATYQAPVVKKMETSDTVEVSRKTTDFGNDGMVSEISKDTRVIKSANEESSAEDGSNEGNQKQPSKETVKQTITDINKRLTNNTECLFGVHEKTNRVMIQIVDKDTKEVIRELPPEKTLDMIAKAWELAGILVDEKL